MSFAIVILSYNHPELTARAVRSAERLKRAGDLVCLVHNGSEVRHQEQLQKSFPEVRHIILSPNRGYAGGVNAGLQHVFKESAGLHCDWALLLTNDSSLENLPSYPQSPGIVAPKILRRNTERIDSCGGLFFPSKARLAHCRSETEFAAVAESTTCRRYIPGTCFLVHREVFEKVGALNEKFGIYWDDVEWSLRIAKAGYPLQTNPHWLVRHGMSKTGASNPQYSLYYFQRNRKWVCLANTSGLNRLIVFLRLTKDWLRLLLKNLQAKRFKNLHYFWKILTE